jgi:hypothetical protein
VAALAAPLAALAQTPAISTVAVGLPLTWSECRTRASRALTAEGYASLNDTGNGWEAWARGGVASVMCLAGSGETLVTIVASGPPESFEVVAERTRLLERLRSDTAAPPTTPASPPPLRQIGQGWGVDANSVRGRNRERFTVRCGAGGPLGPVWGAGPYTDDSSICTAAVHAGVITQRAGGTVTIEVRPGQPSYGSSSRNGVTSADFGVWEGSFVVVPPAPPPATGGTGWSATASQHRGRNGERLSYYCPAGGPAGGVWGTDSYTDDSSVCGAAVHAGVVTIFGGGSVLIELRPGAGSYQGSTRNGLTSESFGPSPGSFVFVR